MGHVEIRRIDEADMTPDLDAAIRRLLSACFPKDAATFARSRPWHDCVPAYSLVACVAVCHRRAGGVSEAASVAGHVAVVVRDITCGDASVTVAGVQSLAVTPEFRGTGLSRRLMTEAMDKAKRRGIEYSLLFCLPGLERFYASLGWVRTSERVTMRDEQGRSTPIPASNIAMLLALGTTPFPAGPIDIGGRDW